MVGDGHVRVLLSVEDSQGGTGSCQDRQQLVSAAVGDLELGEVVEAAHEVEQLALNAGLALDVEEQVEDGQAGQLVTLVED